MKSFRRIVPGLLLGILILGGGLVALLPYWLPVAAKPLAGKYNIEWESASALEWTHLEVRDLRFTSDKVSIRVDKLTIPQPLRLLWYRLGRGNRPEASIGTVVIQSFKERDATRPTTAGGGFAQLEDIRKGILEGLPWMPATTVEAISIRTAGSAGVILLQQISISERELKGRVAGIPQVPSLDVTVELLDDRYRLAASAPEWLDVRFEADAAPGLAAAQLSARLFSGEVPVSIEVDFPAGGWTPGAVRAAGQGWPVPRALSERLAWRNHSLQADGSFEWSGSSYSASLHLKGDAGLPGQRIEPVDAHFAFTGDKVFLKLIECRIKTDWLVANLSEPVSFSFVSRHFLKDGRFELEADLDGQDMFPAKGRLRAKAIVHTRDRKQPEMRLTVSGDMLELYGWTFPALAMEGTYDYPMLGVEALQVDLGTESSIAAKGQLNLREKSIEAAGSFILDPAWIGNYFDAQSINGAVTGEVKVSGPLNALQHEGRLEPTPVSLEGLHPMTVSAGWSGSAGNPVRIRTTAENDAGGSLELDLDISPAGSGSAWLAEVYDVVVRDSQNTLRLELPFSVQVETRPQTRVDQVSLFALAGGGSHINGSFTRDSGKFHLEGSNIDLMRLQDWTTQPGIPVFVDAFAVNLSQLQPFLAADFFLNAHAADEELKSLDVAIEGNIGSEGIILETVQGTMDERTFMEGQFCLPLLIHPQGKGSRFSPVAGNSIAGTLDATISKELAGKLPPLPGIGRIPEMRAHLTAEGTPEEPVAGIELYLIQFNPLLELDAAFAEYPLENLVLQGRLSRETFELERLEASMRDARISGRGSLDIEAVNRFAAREDKDWHSFLEGHDIEFRFENFRARSFAEILPAFIRSTGKIDGNLAIRPGKDIHGSLRLADFSLRPTLYSPTVDDIDLQLDIENTLLRLQQARAMVGNSDVSLSGYIDLRDWDKPAYDIHLTGERTPLFRTPDLLLHGDINLRLDGSQPSRPAVLAGTIRLRDSVMLMDIDPMGARTSGQELPKPPFFSISKPPFSEWILDVNIFGEEFLNFRSPYVRAVISTQMDLTGTAANPLWVGNIYTADGTVDFPGLRMALSRSEMFITRDRQDTLFIDINAIGQVASYVVSLKADQSIDDPHVEFAATPDLNNTQILHLLATGSPDRTNLGSVGLYLGKGLFDAGASNSMWDRLSVEIGRDVSESSKDTLDLFYDISDRWRIHGQYDKYDAQNLNLEWEVFSR